jgi:diamine N-acetyltransferase
MIRKIDSSEIDECVSVIRKSFASVAKEFGITETNCPNHTSFMKAEKLQMQYDSGRLMFAYMDKKKIVGYFSLASNGDGNYELDNLAVLPEYRHKGYGEEMIAFAINKARELGSSKISIGIIEENTKLKNWYRDLGFIHIGTKIFEYFPFTVGFMEIEIK